MTWFVVLAVVGALMVAAGVGWLLPAAGLIMLGVETIGAAYLGLYFQAKPDGKAK
jgi:hypothetical protein